MPPKRKRFTHYAVWKGRVCGVFSEWDECHASVNGFPGAGFRGFHSHAEASRALSSRANDSQPSPSGGGDSLRRRRGRAASPLIKRERSPSSSSDSRTRSSSASRSPSPTSSPDMSQAASKKGRKEDAKEAAARFLADLSTATPTQTRKDRGGPDFSSPSTGEGC